MQSSDFSDFRVLTCIVYQHVQSSPSINYLWKRCYVVRSSSEFTSHAFDQIWLEKSQLTLLIMDSTSVSQEMSAAKLNAVPPNSSICTDPIRCNYDSKNQLMKRKKWRPVFICHGFAWNCNISTLDQESGRNRLTSLHTSSASMPDLA